MPDLQILKQHANGRWVEILATLAPSLGEAVSNPRRHHACPIHGGKDGLRAFKDVDQTGGVICNTCGPRSDGIASLMWVNGWDFKFAMQAVDEFMGNPCAAVERATQERRSSQIKKVWGERQRMSWPLMTYLKNRGLGELRNRVPECLCAHSSLEYWSEGSGHWKLSGRYNGMIAPFTDMDGNLVSIHRTFLDENGNKANVLHPKKNMKPSRDGELNGCSIKLYPATEELAITEGIETALAVHLMTGLPVWATGSAGLMMTVNVPPSVKKVHVYADRDRSGTGEAAAREMVTRLLSEKRVGRVLLPNGPIPDGQKSLDWLDVYRLQQEVTA